MNKTQMSLNEATLNLKLFTIRKINPNVVIIESSKFDKSGLKYGSHIWPEPDLKKKRPDSGGAGAGYDIRCNPIDDDEFVVGALQRKRPESAGLTSVKSRPVGSTANANNNNNTFAGLNPTLTGEEIRILRRAREEHSRRGGWVRIFPSASSWDSYR